MKINLADVARVVRVLRQVHPTPIVRAWARVVALRACDVIRNYDVTTESAHGATWLQHKPRTVTL